MWKSYLELFDVLMRRMLRFESSVTFQVSGFVFQGLCFRVLTCIVCMSISVWFYCSFQLEPGQFLPLDSSSWVSRCVMLILCVDSNCIIYSIEFVKYIFVWWSLFGSAPIKFRHSSPLSISIWWGVDPAAAEIWGSYQSNYGVIL